MVFDITYIRILFPSKIFKFFSLKFFIIFISKTILYLFHPIIRWLFYIKYIYSVKKPYDFWEFIFINYENKEDIRCLLYLSENGWNHNPGPEFYQILSQLKLNNHTAQFTDVFLQNTAYKIFYAFQEIKHINAPYNLQQILIPGTPIAHPAILNNQEFNVDAEYALFTSLPKAIVNNMYGKTIIIPKIITNKQSVLLAHNDIILSNSSNTGYVTPSYLAQNLLNFKNDPQVIQLSKEFSYSTSVLPSRVNAIYNIKASLFSDIHNSILNEGYNHEFSTQYIQKILNYMESYNHTFNII